MDKIDLEEMILYKDDDILVVAKPAGISVTPEGWDQSKPCLHHLLREPYPDVMIAHRLDKDTSGVMVFARSADAHRVLSAQFEHHLVQKKYLALVNGVPDWEETSARHRLRVDVGKKHRTVVDHAHGMNSETLFKVIEKFNGYALVSAIPKTGRTHQIRVHLYAKGFPIVGDPLYGEYSSKLIGRAALHAAEIAFEHPAGQGWMRFECPLPPDIMDAIQKIKAGKG